MGSCVVARGRTRRSHLHRIGLADLLPFKDVLRPGQSGPYLSQQLELEPATTTSYHSLTTLRDFRRPWGHKPPKSRINEASIMVRLEKVTDGTDIIAQMTDDY